MKAKRARLAAALLISLAALPAASAHYLWITIDSTQGDHGVVDVVFEGGIRPGDGKYMDRFVARGTTWIRTPADSKYRVLEMTDQKTEKLRWLQAALADPAPRVLESYGRFGVYTYGDTETQLHYYAKHIDTLKPEVLAKLGKSSNLELDLVPGWKDGKLHLKVFWKGKPAVGARIWIRGAGRGDLVTDDNGRAVFTPEKGGPLQIRTTMDVDKSGTDPADKKDFTAVKHQSTLTLTVPAPDE